MTMNVVEILVTAKNLTGPALAETNAKLGKTSGLLGTVRKTGVLAGAALVAVGVEGVKAASKFNSEMSLLQTQAGVSQAKMKGLSQGVLALAGKVGQDPDSLAQSLYHVESNFESMGISSKKALELTKVAAEGASVGHAKLVDVTNALTAAVASGIPGVQNMSKAMGVLNATVGIGDMSMQDLASAFGSGMVATVKGFGLSIQDVGAALAVFGDNNIRGSAAGNQLRMSVMALAKPVATAGDALKKLGLQDDTLAKDMQRGGLKMALQDLVDHMQKAGITSKQQGAIITDAFGRKAGAGLNILVSQMDRLDSKYPALEAGANGFDKAWAQTQKNFAFQEKQLQASFQALLIEIGDRLMPVVQLSVDELLKHKQATVIAAGGLATLLAATVAVSAAMKVAALSTAAWSAAGKGAAAVAAVFETVALKAMFLQDAFAAAGGGVAGLRAAFASLSTGMKLGVAVTAVAGLVIAIKELSDHSKAAPPNVDRLTTAIGNLGRTGAVSGEALRVFGKGMGDLTYDVNRVAGASSGMDRFNDVMNKVFTLGLAKSNSAKQASQNMDALDQSLASLVTSGHADLAAAAVKKLTDQYAKSGGSPKKLVGELKDYNGALASNALAAKTTADSQGLFGEAAQKTQAALTAQKDAADGLTQSIQALNDVNRSGLSASIDFEQSIADTTKAMLKDKGALSEHHGQLVLTTQKARDAASALNDLAAKTDADAAAAKTQGKSWGDVMAIYDRGRSKLLAAAEAMGLTKSQAKALADQILKVPDKTAKVKGNLDDLEAKLKKAKGELASVPDSRRASIQAEISDLEKKIAQAKAAVSSLHGKTVTITTVNYDKYVSVGKEPGKGTVLKKAAGGIVGAAASGGVRDGLTLVGEKGPEYVKLPYGSTVIPAGTTRSMSKGERTARSGAVGDLTVSYFGQKAGYRQNEFEKALSKPGSLKDLTSALNKWKSTIEKATHGSTQSKLTRDIDRGGAALITNEKRLQAVNSALATAKDKLSSLKDSFDQLKTTVKSAVVAYGDPTSSIDQGGGLAGVMNRMQSADDQATAFAQALGKLAKRGLSKTVINELAQAGPGAGLQTAEALLSASAGDITSINKMQSQIASAGTSAGTTAANAMYGAGIKAAQGVVDGLKKDQGKIEKEMDKIADSLSRAIKKALDVHNKKASGGIIGAASGGARGGWTLVGERGPELARLPYGSTVYPAGQSRRMVGAMVGAGGAPVVIELRSSGSAVDNMLLQILRGAIRTRGGNVQVVLGGAR
jgi:TP901 family phage tail tape measure protein